MWRGRELSALALVGLLVLLWGCGRSPNFVAREEPWRASEETACLASGMVRPSPFVVARASLGGPSVCGAIRPFEMSAALGGQVALRPAALLRCPMVPAVEDWVRQVVHPAARLHFGMPVIELKVVASYSCRPMNHVAGARLSEHGHANALDVAAVLLANGRWVTVKGGWYGDVRERAFLRALHQGACQIFSTVLGPNYDANHRDHFHLDLARHGTNGARQICR
jgi:hypothetical protein